VSGSRAVVLLGAFDPPTLAHVAVLDAAARSEGVPGALCLTKVLLARSPDELLTAEQRLAIVDTVAGARSYGLALANRGTYIDVHRGMRATGIDATFVIGSDKLAQLADPSFYPDGSKGVEATFAEVDFLVVPRADVDLGRNDLRVLGTAEVFDEPAQASISSTEVRRRIREGVVVEGLVPPEVVVDLEGYTAAK
jgi:nicotinic acid mononucleotide adenylyltransferase